MPIPLEILAVDRPKNTKVYQYGKSRTYYGVRERSGCKYIDGRRVPLDGPTIGHIVMNEKKEWVYVPKQEQQETCVSQSPTDLKDWANIVLCDNLCRDLLTDLLKFYCKEDALKIYCISVLRVCDQGIKDYELQDAYRDSFLSELYPNVPLSKNTISTFLEDVGRTYSRIIAFMQDRVERVLKTDHLLIDGTLKSCESEVNSLSDYSRKAKTKGTRDISLLYCFDLDLKEPVCSKCFPGNMLDSTSYEGFISEYQLTKGLIIGDKGFPHSTAKEYFEAYPDLHYLNPLKRDSKYINEFDLFNFDGQLEGHENILYKRVYVEKERKWLYSFKDTVMAHKENYGCLHQTNKKRKEFSMTEYLDEVRKFGTILIESDLEMDPLTAYITYDSRWEIELVMRYYKQACEFDETREHNDYSVIGSEFCCFLSSVMTYRFINRFEEVGLFKRYGYKKIVKLLARAKKVKPPGKEWKAIRMNDSLIEVLQQLELLPKPASKRRGRLKKIT